MGGQTDLRNWPTQSIIPPPLATPFTATRPSTRLAGGSGRKGLCLGANVLWGRTAFFKKKTTHSHTNQWLHPLGTRVRSSTRAHMCAVCFRVMYVGDGNGIAVWQMKQVRRKCAHWPLPPSSKWWPRTSNNRWHRLAMSPIVCSKKVRGKLTAVRRNRET